MNDRAHGHVMNDSAGWSGRCAARGRTELLPRAAYWSQPLVGLGLILLGLLVLASAAMLASWSAM
jgi:hypothetical protein